VVRCQQQNELRLQSSLTDASLAWLAPLKHLRTLSLRSCVMVEGGGLRHITALSMLRSLDLTGCVRLTNKGARMYCGRMCKHVCI
jgi:Leucine Rich repeat